MRAAIALLLLLTIASPLAAASGGEICRFAALDAENPFRRWLASQEVACVAAGAPVVFPKGLWNVFARAEGRVSAEPLLVDGGAAPVAIEPALGPGAAIAPLLPEGYAGVVYAPRRGSAFPVDGPRVTVPADEPLWLFVLEKSVPVALVPVGPLAPGSEREVDARRGGPASVVGWLHVPEADRTALRGATGVLSPAIRAGAREADPLPPSLLLHGAFFRIGDVAEGNVELRLEGRGWVPDRRVVKVGRAVTVAPVPLLVRATGTLLVHWNTDQDLPKLDRLVGSCEGDEDRPQVAIAISKCSEPRRGQRPDAGDCVPIREKKADAFFGSVTFDDVVPGLFRAEMRYGKLPPVSQMASAGPVRVTDLRLFASYFTLYGSITRGGEPLEEDVTIEFPGGVGFAEAESEEYRAVLLPSSMTPEMRIEVAACDGAPRAVVVSDRPVRPYGRLDIDIPLNELTVHVSDTFTREALPGAAIKLEAMSNRRPTAVFSAAATTDAHGNASWTSVPERTLHLTVSHAGYETRRVPPFTMPKSGEHSVDVQLVPLRGTRGKVVSTTPFQGGAVVWFSADGLQTERADLAADGTFVYGNRHTPDETMAVVSASHPLWVLRSPATEGRESISVRFPDAPAAAFDVWRAAAVPQDETRYINVAVAGVRVPQPVLAEHQALRRDPPLMRGAGPHRFRDLLATGTIDVILGPRVEEVPSRARSMDLFALPQFAGGPRQRLEPGTADVVFSAGAEGR